ncbi:helix-turn-helix transcriptional regulator [Nocardiopsis sp. RSe5-2]|uniref:Helix-turn-helix transcriptional regulator n=1 Tax=Nocardiopsis endophytica TaxID=3018445 RepID=A0ABT4U7T7_9ACTN|nr:helix-turn-helix transcriptional regulator [Nocardiopsis endophytica]MDA2813026.1 helix-turn-helix transcriptional regulator [Nocardiopsis endophytica]
MPPDKRVLQAYGAELRRLRNEAGLVQTALANKVRCSKSQISEVERGNTEPSRDLRMRLDQAIGFGRLERVWEGLTGSGRDAWRVEVAELIQSASAIYDYQVLVFPAYLQTREYAATLMRYGAQWLSEDDVQARAEGRAERSRRLTTTPRPRVWLALDETILQRRYGSPEVMRDQFAYVYELAQAERITLQLIPADTPRHPGNSGAFKLITTDNEPDVMFAETPHEGQIVTNAVDVARYRMQFAALQGAATSPEAALTRLRDEMKRLDDEVA